MANILTVPESGIYFDGNTAGSSAIPTLTGNASGVAIQYDGYAGITISSSATGVDYQDRFSIEGENGRLFGVSDQVVGSVFSVNDAAGLPLIDVEVEQDFSKITLGQFGTDALVISGSSVQVTGSNVVTEGYLSDQSYLTSSTETYSTASELLTALLGVDGANSNLDADKLDSQEGSYYLNYNNFSNTPTIPSAANNATITLSAGTALSGGGDFTTNQSSVETITFNHASVSRSDTTSSETKGFGASFTVVDAVTSNSQGHITAQNVKTVTLPSLGTTSTTALAGNTTVNDVSEANLKARLAALDSNDTLYIGDAGDDTTVVIRGTLQVDGSTTTVNSTTITVDDKNIELGSVASPSDSLADGGGITLKGSTDKTITWIDSTDSWTSNQTFSAPNLTLTSLSAQNSEATVLMINGSNIVGYRELGANAFTSTTIPTNNNQLTNGAGYITGNQTITLSGDVSGSGTTSISVSLAADSVGSTEIADNAVTAAAIAANAVGASEIAASAVGASELNVSGNGTTAQFLRSDGDGTFTWATPTDTNTQLTSSEVRAYISGTGLISYNSSTGVISTTANNYSLPEATATVRGGIELFSNTDQSVAANTVSSTAGRTYGIQLNSAGQAVVNVPWSDTNTVYTHPTHAGDDISIDTGPLTGATVISDLDFNITTNTLGHVTDANGTVSTRTLTAANLGISAPNAPTSLSASIVGETIDLTFNASSTSNIDAYLVYSSVDGGDYGLIQVIPPDDFSATMSVIDSAFTVTGTQAYRVYAMKYGILSSAGTASVSYTVSSAEPTDMSVVNLNNAYFVQWNPPSANERFVSAYNVYKHEAAASGSLLRSSASLVYSGLNTNFMYQISGNNNSNYHQFWVETTIA